MDLPRSREHARPRRRSLATMALAVALLALLPTPVTHASQQEAFVTKIHAARTSHGLRPLRSAPSLRESSVEYSEWMVDHQYFGHLASIRAPRRFGLRGEVLARSFANRLTARRIVRKWLRSPSHRAVLLDPRFRFVGVSLARGSLGLRPVTFVTGHFGGPLRAPSGRVR